VTISRSSILGVLAVVLLLIGQQVVAATIECIAREDRKPAEVNGKQVFNVERTVWLVLKPNAPDSYRYLLSYRGVIDQATGQLKSENPSQWSPLSLPWNTGYLQFSYMKNGKSIDYFGDKMPTFSVIHDKDTTATVQMRYEGADLDCTLVYSYTVSDTKLVLQVFFAPKIPIERYRLLFRGSMKGNENQLVLTPLRTITRTEAGNEAHMVELDPVKEYRLVYSSTQLTAMRSFALITLPGAAMASHVYLPGEARAIFEYGPSTKSATFFLYNPRDDGQAGVDYFNAITLTQSAGK